MASTRLQRKARRNKARAKKKVATIQRLNQKPVIKNVDIEEIKKEFAQKKAGKKTAEAPMADKAEAKLAKEAAKVEKAEEPKTEKKAEKAESPKAEKKAEPKKAEKAEAVKEEEAGVDVEALINSVGKADGRSKDDLKNINGIGPAFEKKLNEIGIYSYEQISKLTKKDIENLGNMDGLSAEKIESDDWKGSAKEQIKLAKKDK